jgi:hypothetical protein
MPKVESRASLTQPELLTTAATLGMVNSATDLQAEEVQMRELEMPSRVDEEPTSGNQIGAGSVPAVENGDSEGTCTDAVAVSSDSSKNHGISDPEGVDPRRDTDSDAYGQNTIAETDSTNLSSLSDNGEFVSKAVDQDDSAAEAPEAVAEQVNATDDSLGDLTLPDDSSHDVGHTSIDSRSGLADGENPQESEARSAAESDSPRLPELEQEVGDLDTESNVETDDPDSSPTQELRAPRRYRPAPRVPLHPRRTAGPNGNDAAVRTKALSVAIRLSFRPSGVCEWSLLAQKRDDLPSEIEVTRAEGTELFIALQDDWYEMTSPPDWSALLVHGAVWTVTGTTASTPRWTLARRDICVLGAGADFAGYITVPRLVIGEEHAILFLADRRQSVLDALAAAGCGHVAEVDPSEGVPEGWILLKHVRPTDPVSTANDGGILDSLRPLASVEIVLQGGIQVDRIEWLHGHPPTIRLRGDIASAGDILVDGQHATIGDQGKCDAPGQDTLGEHSVWTASTSRTYRIVEGLENWETWPAHDFPGGVICGGGVYPPPTAGPDARGVIVPSRDAVLIGTKPGQIHYCSPKNAWRSPVSIVFPSFEPVWSIPRFPLRCDKRDARVVLLSPRAPLSVRVASQPRKPAYAIREWSRLVLDAHRRGLRLSPSEEQAEALWEQFALVAREIWRHMR